MTGHAGRYRRLAERLAGDAASLAVDLRGHGRSTWEAPWGIETHVADLVETADALGVTGAAAWIGHSLGGRLVAELAAREPERVERAVLLDPALHVEPQVATERAALLRDDVSFGSPDEAIDARLGDGTLFTTPRETSRRRPRSTSSAATTVATAGATRRRAVIVAWSEMATEPPPWPQCPTLVVVGAQSWIPIRVPRLAAPDESLPVPGGHSVLWDDFDETAAAVVEFLAASRSDGPSARALRAASVARAPARDPRPLR